MRRRQFITLIGAANMRATDVIGRLGGEEFAAILPGTAADARLVAERLRMAFESAGVAIAGHQIGATVSVGVATAIPPVQIDPLLARADAALYRAKHDGRNRVECDGADVPATIATPSSQSIPALGQAVAALQ